MVAGFAEEDKGYLELRNTGILHCVQDDDIRRRRCGQGTNELRRTTSFRDLGSFFASYGRDCVFGAAGESLQDCFARGVLEELIDKQSERDDDRVGDPGVEGSHVQPLRDAVEVKQDEDVEVKQIEAVAAFADQEDRLPRKYR